MRSSSLRPLRLLRWTVSFPTWAQAVLLSAVSPGPAHRWAQNRRYCPLALRLRTAAAHPGLNRLGSWLGAMRGPVPLGGLAGVCSVVGDGCPGAQALALPEPEAAGSRGGSAVMGTLSHPEAPASIPASALWFWPGFLLVTGVSGRCVRVTAGDPVQRHLDTWACVPGGSQPPDPEAEQWAPAGSSVRGSCPQGPPFRFPGPWESLAGELGDSVPESSPPLPQHVSPAGTLDAGLCALEWGEQAGGWGPSCLGGICPPRVGSGLPAALASLLPADPTPHPTPGCWSPKSWHSPGSQPPAVDLPKIFLPLESSVENILQADHLGRLYFHAGRALLGNGSPLLWE